MPKRSWDGVVRDNDKYVPPVKHKAPPHVRALQDKTIQLLYKGANKKICDEVNIPSYSSKETSIVPFANSKPMKQMCIDNCGALILNGAVIEQEPNSCEVCKMRCVDEIVKCSYCDMSQCTSCFLMCSACSTPTCNRCSISSYRDCEGIFCFSCCK